MAGIGGATLAEDALTDNMVTGGPGGYEQTEVDAMVLDRRARLDASDIQPQFHDPMKVGYDINGQYEDKPLGEQMVYTRPLATPSRLSRMPHWFGIGIARWDSIAHWPFLRCKFRVPLAIGMAHGKLPRVSPGWDGPRVNIVSNGSMPYGNLTALYPALYPTTEDV